MRLLHHTKSKVALLVCLFLLVVTAAPAPPSPSVDLAVPPPVYSPGSSAKPTVTFVHPLDTGQQKAPGATVVAGIVIYAPKSLTPGLILAAKTLLKPAIPAIMSHLRKSKGLDYTITDDFEVSVTKVWPRPERRQQTEFFHLVLSFAGRDNNGKVWDMKSPNEAYLLTISKQCVEQRAKSTDKLQFQPKLLSGELRQIESMKLLAKFKNGMQLDLQAAATAPMPSATVKQKSSWFGMLKDKVFPTKQSQGGQSS